MVYGKDVILDDVERIIVHLICMHVLLNKISTVKFKATLYPMRVNLKVK